MRSVVIGSGFVLGEHRVENEQLARVCDTSDTWIRERSGIESRYYVSDGTTTSDLGTRAAQLALEDAQLAPEDIDYVVFATMTPDYYFPGCGPLLQRKLGLHAVPTLDIRQQCTGFLYGLQVADALLTGKAARRLLLVCADVHSGFMPWKDTGVVLGTSGQEPTAEERAFNTRFRDRTILFGDAGSAVVLTLSDTPDRGLIDVLIHSDGAQAEKLYVPSGFAWRPYLTEEMIREGRHIPVMDGRAVFRAAVTKMPEAVREILRQNGLGLDEVKMLVPHQANLRISEAVQDALGLPDDRVYNNVQRYGNTSNATIPSAYHECRQSGRIRHGDLVCFVGMGAGFQWGAALIRD